jgi:hypothetical protein
MTNKELLFNLIRKIRDRRLEPFSPLTLNDVKHYRLYLIQKGDLCTEVEKDEILFLTQLIRYYDRPYIEPDEQNSLEFVQLCIGFTDSLFEQILPLLCNIISQDSEWVAVYHIMIYDGWMSPVDFYAWVKWLNDRLYAIGKQEVLGDSAHRKVNNYLKRPERYKWSLDEYLKEKKTDSKKTINVFKRLCVVCEQVRHIFDGTIDDKMMLGSGISSIMFHGHAI